MNTYYLRFADRAQALSVLSELVFEGEMFSTRNTTVLDIGQLQVDTGEVTVDEEGNESPVMEALPGYHVNVLSREEIHGLIDYSVFPDTVQCTWL